MAAVCRARAMPVKQSLGVVAPALIYCAPASRVGTVGDCGRKADAACRCHPGDLVVPVLNLANSKTAYD